MPQIPSVELLNSTHVFPGPYVFKAIGDAEGGFADRVVAAARAESPVDLKSSVRPSADGRYVAVTLEIRVPSAEAVVSLYQRLLSVQGLRLLL